VTFLPLPFQYAESPPSKGIAVPVIQEDSSDARHKSQAQSPAALTPTTLSSKRVTFSPGLASNHCTIPLAGISARGPRDPSIWACYPASKLVRLGRRVIFN